MDTTTGGFVLAGGRSSRMGRDKSGLLWRGKTLIAHVASEVKSAAGTVATVGGVPVDGVPHLVDRWPDFGPVGGITTALKVSDAAWNLVVACDMPMVAASFLRTLLAAAGESEAVLPVTADGRMHPLCAAYSRGALPVWERAVAEGIHRVMDVVDRLQTVRLPVVDANLLSNVNTPEEWVRARAEERT